MNFGIDPNKLNLQLNLDNVDYAAVAKATAAAIEKEKSPRQAAKSSHATGEQTVENSSTRGEEATKDGSIRGIVGAEKVHASGNPAVAHHQVRAENPGAPLSYSLLDALNDCLVSQNWAKADQMFQNAVAKAIASVPIGSNGDESAAWETLYNVQATTPPALQHTSGLRQERHRMTHFVGVMRWKNFHFTLLMRTLIQCQRWRELEAVWSTLKRLGFVRFHLDAKAANTLITSIRALSEAYQQEGPGAVFDATARVVARQILLDIDEVCNQRSIAVSGKNRLVMQHARIAAAILQRQEGATVDDPVTVTASDFGVLLRHSTSHAATVQILQEMERLGIALSADSYANIIVSLQNPLYLVQDGSVDEPQEYASSSGTAAHDQEKYERYKVKRISSARMWFYKCEADMRSASVFNEFLYLLRGKAQAEEYNEILLLYRGGGLLAADGSLAPPHWSTQPDAKTYEALILRARYVHQWEVMWGLHSEMENAGIEPTGKTLQMLIAEVKTHPPPHVAANVEGMAKLTIELYMEMRKSSKRNEVDADVSAINAWSRVRRRRG